MKKLDSTQGFLEDNLMEIISVVKIVEIINQNIEGISLTEAKYDEDLSKLGMDSFTFIRIIIALEEAFKCEIPDSYILISEMNTVNKINKVLNDIVANM